MDLDSEGIAAIASMGLPSDQIIFCDDNSLGEEFKFTSENVTSDGTGQTRCFICNTAFFDTAWENNENGNKMNNNDPSSLVKSLFHILKVRSFEQLVGSKNLEDAVVPKRSLLCPTCLELTCQAQSLERTIKELQGLLQITVGKIRSALVNSYGSNRAEEKDKEESSIAVCRKALHQRKLTISSCRVDLQRCEEADIEAAKLKKNPAAMKLGRHYTARNAIRGPRSSFKTHENRTRKKTHPHVASEIPKIMVPSAVGQSVDRPCADPDYDPEMSGDEKLGGSSDMEETDAKPECTDDPTDNNGVGFACSICSKVFTKRINMRIHENRKHGMEHKRKKFLPNQCQFCGKDFNDAPAIQSSEKKVQYRCDSSECDCGGQTFSTFHHFKYHHYRKCPKRRENTELEKLRAKGTWICEHCGKKFEDVSNLRYHLRSVHEKKFKYCCEICGHGTQIQSMLKRHMIVHSDEKPYKCDKCDYSCRRPGQLYYHKRYHHENEKPHLCSECGKSFLSNAKLQLHAASHATIKEFPCPHCDKFFACKNYVTSHVNSTHKGRRRERYYRKKGIIHNESIEAPGVMLGLEPINETDSISGDEVMQAANQVAVQLVEGTASFDIVSAEPATFIEIQ